MSCSTENGMATMETVKFFVGKEGVKMLNSRIVKKEDYERYSVSIPVRNLFGKNRKRYLYGELDKLHPCFSEKCCFDSRLYVKNKSLCADVIVMEKLKLAEYRYRFPGKFLVIEECLKRRLFGTLDYEKLIMLFVGLFFIVTFSCVNIHKKQKVPVSLTSEIFTETETPVDSQPELNDFFELLSGELAKCNEFEWNWNGNDENIAMSVFSIFPEKILAQYPEVEINQVSYKDNTPILKISLNHKRRIPNQNYNLEENYSLEDVRDCVMKCGGHLLEENLKNKQLCFSGTDIQLRNVFSKLYSQFDLYDRNINHLKIENLAEGKKVYIQFSLVSGSGCSGKYLLKTVCNYWESLFESDKKKESTDSRINKKTEGQIVRQVKVSDENAVPQKNNGNRFGRIVHGDGSEVLFYKNNQQKIVHVSGGGK